MPVTAPEVDRALHHDRAREKDIERISHRLVLRLQPIQSLRFETPLAARRELPSDRAGAGIERIQFPVVANRVERSVDHRRSRWRRPARGLFPNLPPGLGSDGIDVPVVAAKIDDTVAPDWRRDDPIAGRKFPFDPMKLARRRTRIHPGMRRITAKHRLRLANSARPRRRAARR